MGANPIEEWLSTTFLEYQVRWICDPAAIALALKGRQFGFTDGTAGRIIMRGLLAQRPQVFISASQGHADELIETVRSHCALLAALGRDDATDWDVDNAGELRWRSGGSVTALSSNPRTARGYHGDLYLDEFAYHADPKKLWKAAAPMATRGGWQIRIISTPNGAQGEFYEWVHNPPPGWSIHEVGLKEAEADGYPVDRARLLELVGGDVRIFAEAYELAFLDANLQYLPTALANRARDWKGALPDLSTATWYAGLDVGRKRDVTALTVLAVVSGIAYVVAVITCPRTKFKLQRKMVREAREVFQWETLHVDATGLGTQFAEELVEEFGPEEVVPVLFTEASKEDLCTRALKWHRDGQVRYPRGAAGKALHKQAISLRRIVTDKGHVTYGFPRTADGHGDEFTALMLALKGAGEPPIIRGMGASPILNVA